MNIHSKLAGLFCIISLGLFCISSTFAYDLNANFTQSMPELVSGFFLKAGPTSQRGSSSRSNAQDSRKGEITLSTKLWSAKIKDLPGKVVLTTT